MATRHQTYQMPYGWITIDTQKENPPVDFIAGPFDVTLPEVADIKSNATIELNESGTDVVIIPDGET